MVPSGTMAQQSVLRVLERSTGQPAHRHRGLSHLLEHEQDGPRLLNDFQWALLTPGATPGGVVPTVDPLAAIPGALGAAVLELLLRDGGYLLPSWEELEAFSLACSDRACRCTWAARGSGSPVPTSGTPQRRSRRSPIRSMSRSTKACVGWPALWSPDPRRSSAEVGLWRSRHGGTLWTMLPYAVSALGGLRDELPRMAEYHQRALEMAELLAAKGFRIFPGPRTATPSASSSRHLATSSPSGWSL